MDDAGVLPREVLAELDTHGHSQYQLAQLSADVRSVFDDVTGEKLGLGSSAASTVALTAACMLDSSDEPVDESIDPKTRAAIFEHAFRAHRSLQGGRGSGADIASSAFGGVIAYRLVEPVTPFSACEVSQNIAADVTTDDAQVSSALSFPDDLRIEALWLESPARSTSFVRCCEEALAEAPGPTQRALCRTSAIAEEALGAFARGRTAEIVELAATADEALTKLGEQIGAPIAIDAHRALRKPARAASIAVKPSGAGGGDFSLAFGPVDAAWESFLQNLPPGVRHIPLELGAQGVRREPRR
jgi:phosphomevalonate kinase